MRRVATGLVLAICVFGCASQQPQRQNRSITRGKTNAVIAIHVAPAGTIGSADAEDVRLCARNGMAGSTPVPSHISWVADDPTARLDIVWKDPAQVCVRGKHCEGAVCSGISNVDFKGPDPVTCEYSIVINGTTAKDPGVTIEPCCP